jgi:hypothetical protein
LYVANGYQNGAKVAPTAYWEKMAEIFNAMAGRSKEGLPQRTRGTGWTEEMQLNIPCGISAGYFLAPLRLCVK